VHNIFELTVRRIVFITTIGFLLLTLAGCTEPPTDAVRFGLANAPTNLDPRFATDATSDRVNRLLYARLVDFNDAFEPIPALAHWSELGLHTSDSTFTPAEPCFMMERLYRPKTSKPPMTLFWMRNMPRLIAVPWR